jgi:hypothetical protein
MAEGETYGDGVGDLTDDALVGSVGVRGRHDDVWLVGVVWVECVFELVDESVCKGKREQGEGEVNKGLDLWRGTCLGDVELSVGVATSFQPQGRRDRG